MMGARKRSRGFTADDVAPDRESFSAGGAESRGFNTFRQQS